MVVQKESILILGGPYCREFNCHVHKNSVQFPRLQRIANDFISGCEHRVPRAPRLHGTFQDLHISKHNVHC